MWLTDRFTKSSNICLTLLDLCEQLALSRRNRFKRFGIEEFIDTQMHLFVA